MKKAAKAAANLLPPLSDIERLEVTKIHSIFEASNNITYERPFRSPHHSASSVAVVGGGSSPKPGEISLAHLGILFLDELPEYPRSILESLRQPMEDRQITISRTSYRIRFPADFMLVATMNPCPCGYLGDSQSECTCTHQQITSYQKRLSGPLLDRIDLVIPVSRASSDDLLSKRPVSNLLHAEAQRLIMKAIGVQQKRYNCCNRYNSSASSDEIDTLFNMRNDAREILIMANDKLKLSTRSYFKVIKVARTIADMEESDEITSSHISEALLYRKR